MGALGGLLSLMGKKFTVSDDAWFEEMQNYVRTYPFMQIPMTGYILLETFILFIVVGICRLISTITGLCK